MVTKNKTTTPKQAERMVRKEFLNEHGKRAYNATVDFAPSYYGGTIVRISNGHESSEIIINRHQRKLS